MMFEGKDGDYRLLMKAATAAMIVAIVFAAVASFIVWFGILILGVALILKGWAFLGALVVVTGGCLPFWLFFRNNTS